METYLSKVSNFKYRNAITKFRTSSHDLEIEKGRHNPHRLPLEQRLCKLCNVIEDEVHFLLSCGLYNSERTVLFNGFNIQNPRYVPSHELFVYVMCSKNQRHLELLGEFIYKSFKKRSEYIQRLA